MIRTPARVRLPHHPTPPYPRESGHERKKKTNLFFPRPGKSFLLVVAVHLFHEERERKKKRGERISEAACDASNGAGASRAGRRELPCLPLPCRGIYGGCHRPRAGPAWQRPTPLPRSGSGTTHRSSARRRRRRGRARTSPSRWTPARSGRSGPPAARRRGRGRSPRALIKRRASEQEQIDRSRGRASEEQQAMDGFWAGLVWQWWRSSAREREMEMNPSAMSTEKFPPP